MKVHNLKSLFLAVPLVFSLVTAPGCDKDDDDDIVDQTYTISGNASGTQMVPSVAGTGSATLSGTYNANSNVLTYTSNWTGLTGAPSSAAFYSGASGTAGTIVGSNWTLGSGLTGTGTFSGTMTLTDAQETQFLNNGWYYSYGTTANPNGEVRGQITALQ